MAERINMPKLGLTMTEGTMGKWKKNIGDTIAIGDVLVEVMTDKITSEVESSVTGVLRVIAAKEGATIPVQGLLAIIGSADEKIDEVSASCVAGDTSTTTPAVKKEAKSSGAARRLAEEKGIDIQSVPGSGPDGRIVIADVEKYLETAPQVTTGGRVKASPFAKKIAKELSVDLTTVIGTGPEGRIVEADVQKASQAQAPALVALAAAAIQKVAVAPVEGELLIGMRKVIAERMTFSKHTAPHVTLMTEVNLEATVASRTELN